MPGHREGIPAPADRDGWDFGKEFLPLELPGMQFPSSWCPLKAWIGRSRRAKPRVAKIHEKGPKIPRLESEIRTRSWSRPEGGFGIAHSRWEHPWSRKGTSGSGPGPACAGGALRFHPSLRDPKEFPDPSRVFLHFLPLPCFPPGFSSSFNFFSRFYQFSCLHPHLSLLSSIFSPSPSIFPIFLCFPLFPLLFFHIYPFSLSFPFTFPHFSLVFPSTSVRILAGP